MKFSGDDKRDCVQVYCDWCAAPPGIRCMVNGKAKWAAQAHAVRIESWRRSLRARAALAATASTRASAAAHRSWALTRDRAARTAAARRGLDARFERQARQLLGDQATDKQIADAAESARKAYYADLAARGRAAQAS